MMFEVATTTGAAEVCGECSGPASCSQQIESGQHTFEGTKVQKLTSTVRPILGAKAAPREAWAAVAAATSSYVTTRIPRFWEVHGDRVKQSRLMRLPVFSKNMLGNFSLPRESSQHAFLKTAACAESCPRLARAALALVTLRYTQVIPCI